MMTNLPTYLVTPVCTIVWRSALSHAGWLFLPSYCLIIRLGIWLPKRPKAVPGLVITIGYAQHPKASREADQGVKSDQGDGDVGPIAPNHGVGNRPSRTFKNNGKKLLIYLTKPNRKRTYFTHQGKGYEIPVALGKAVATG